MGFQPARKGKKSSKNHILHSLLYILFYFLPTYFIPYSFILSESSPNESVSLLLTIMYLLEIMYVAMEKKFGLSYLNVLDKSDSSSIKLAFLLRISSSVFTRLLKFLLCLGIPGIVNWEQVVCFSLLQSKEKN